MTRSLSDRICSKADGLKSTATDCKVTAHSLANFKFSRLDENAVLLTYTARQDALYGGKKAPPALQVTVNHVKRGGRWLEAMYMHPLEVLEEESRSRHAQVTATSGAIANAIQALHMLLVRTVRVPTYPN